MSRLSRLMGKSETIELNGEEFEIKPLKMKEINLFLEVKEGDTGRQGKALMNIIKTTLKKTVPDATDEEMENISMQYFQKFVSVIMKVNGLEDVKYQGKGSTVKIPTTQ